MPYVRVHVDLDDLDIDDEDLADELRQRGYTVTKAGAEPIDDMSDLQHIKHLADCGLVGAARDEALSVIGRNIGRRLN